jgi:hypothetical protein
MPVLTNRMNPKDFKATFLSCEKDLETIINKLFVKSKPYSDILKKLLIVDQSDCLDANQSKYQSLIDKYSIHDLKDKGYITTIPRVENLIHDVPQVVILIEFKNFSPDVTNNYYRDHVISFTIVCPFCIWQLDDFKMRPYQIAGYIDGILNNSKLSGIGILQFEGASSTALDEEYGAFVLRYVATNGNDDKDTFENT